MPSNASTSSKRLGRRRLAALAWVAIMAGCGAGDGAIEAAPQDEYLESAREFESQRAAYAEEVVACAAEQGVEAETTWDHGLVLPPGLEGEEADAYWDVVGDCAEDVYPPERQPSEDELEEQYGLLLAAKQCLDAEGFDISEPSGFDAFVEAYESEGPPLPWSPYEVVAQRPERFRAAVEACPQPGGF